MRLGFVPARMEYPITRAELQNILPKYERAQMIEERAKINANIEEIVEHLSTQIIHFARSPAKRTRQFWIRDLNHNLKHRITTPILSYLDEILAKMTERFPDTTFTLDPMQTYIFVDWS